MENLVAMQSINWRMKMSEALATKYRPQTWDDVTEQESTKIILQNQIQTGEIKNAYLFVGSAGTGKTTCARIFANEINKGLGNPIELDAASNNGVDDVREIIQQAKKKSLDSEYKIFIIDECHALSNNAWQAFLKLIEEPPAKSIFIFATTDPQKIPKTILSRVQRYDFQRISQFGIVQRLKWICDNEGITRYSDNGNKPDSNYADTSAIEYIAKLADGGCRDAITMLDKCLAYSKDLTLENVIKALGTVDYIQMVELAQHMVYKYEDSPEKVVEIIEGIHTSGKDLKQFISQYMRFILDVNKYGVGCDAKYLTIPMTKEIQDFLNDLEDDGYTRLELILDMLVRLKADIKYSQSVKYDVEVMLLLYMR